MIAELKSVSRPVGVLLAILCGTTLGIAAYVILHPVPLAGYDFVAFWCAGKVLLLHASPYANGPLHACEAATSPAFFLHYPQVTIPAPLPPYALAFFSALAFLPFGAGLLLWWLLQVASTIAIARVISQLSGMPPVTALAASGLAILGPAILQAALSPIPIALTVLAALALRKKMWNFAAVLLGAAMIEPHMALPACAAVFLFMPQMRVRLFLAGACAGTLMLTAVGPHVLWSYFTTVLPIHAASEVNNLGQESLTALLYHLGVRPDIALRLGSLQYALLAVVGLVTARRIFGRTSDPSWLILLPAAFAVIGGTFIHLDEVAMAVPLACLIAMRRPGALTFVILVMLALPMESMANWIPLSVPAAAVCVWLMTQTPHDIKRYVSNAVLPAAITLLLIFGVAAMHWATAPHDQQALLGTVQFPHPGNTASASVTWAAYNALAKMSALWWPEKLYTLLPLVLLVGLCIKDAFATQSVSKPNLFFGSGAIKVPT